MTVVVLVVACNHGWGVSTPYRSIHVVTAPTYPGLTIISPGLKTLRKPHITLNECWKNPSDNNIIYKIILFDIVIVIISNHVQNIRFEGKILLPLSIGIHISMYIYMYLCTKYVRLFPKSLISIVTLGMF
jgi:hypothetical protein